MSETDVIEATATDLVEAPPQSPSLFGTNDPVQVVSKATEVADALSDVIRKKGLFNNIQGKSHVRVEGWQLLGSMLGVTAVCVDTEPVDGGFKATVEARTIDGRVVGRADALCTKDEARGPWKKADDYARLSMAQTRATSKALKGPLGFIVSLAGYESTPAEEMTFAEQEPAHPAEVPDKPAVESMDTPSPEQLKFIVGLARDMKASNEDQDLLRDYAATFTKKEASAAIKSLKGGFENVEPGAALLRFLEKAEEWNSKQTDLPADTEGLPEAA